MSSFIIGLHIVVYFSGSQACPVCSGDFVRAACEAPDPPPGGAEPALCRAGPRGDAADDPALRNAGRLGDV